MARAQVATAAAALSDEIENKLEDIVYRVPGGSNVRPLIQSSIQIVLAAAIEGVLRKRSVS